ncbi:MAG TPA: alpha/beta hydrolase-fold protein [Thermomicrobiaceae bacterium]|nr:alpha/beta hydrolase-fold protein [Thermomicrobiaceae bacterium]
MLVVLVAVLGGFLPRHLAQPSGSAGSIGTVAGATAAVPPDVTPESARTSTAAPAQALNPTPVRTPARATPAASPAAPSVTPTPTPAPLPLTVLPGALRGLFEPPAEHGITCQLPPPDDFASCRFSESASPGLSMTFYLFLPQTFDPERRYPLVLLLEGGGERADATNTAEQNREKLLTDPYAAVWGPGVAIPDAPQVQRDHPSFVVIPQVASPQFYMPVPANTGSYTFALQPSDALRMAKEIVDALQQDVAQIDPDRRYVTGLSMGGYGTWEMIERWPDEFAAAAPICGGGDPSQAAPLADLPIWAFQSADDPIVPVQATRDMIAAIEAAGGSPRYTEFTDAGHGAWVPAYGIGGMPSPVSDFYAWLFAQHK